MFQNAREIIITGGNFFSVNGRGKRAEIRLDNALQRLIEAMAPNALYDSDARFDPPRCHPHTRSSIFTYLHKCIRREVDPTVSIIWMYGPAGAGKSAIFQTMAEQCATQERLLASFFYSKSDPTRNHPKGFVATICYQLVQQIEPIKEFVLDAIQRDPVIFNKTLQTQIERLVVEPLQHLVSTGFFEGDTPKPNVILIDGVDECVNPDQRRLFLHGIAYIVTKTHAPIMYLISSRPEHDITHIFSCQQMNGLWTSCALDNNYESRVDIHRFVKESFQRIILTHPYKHFLPPNWPDGDVLESLVAKSSGQFIYASVVVKYASAIDNLPHRRLEVVLGLEPATSGLPFGELDAIYLHVLKSHPNPTAALRIVSCILTGFSLVADIAALLKLDPGNVELAVGPLTSIIDKRHDRLLITHASFFDFLFDQTRSGEFWLGTYREREMVTARQCVDYLNSGQKYNKDNFFLYLLDKLREATHEVNPTDAWCQIVNDLRFDQALPMDDVRALYRLSRNWENELKAVWDIWQPKLMNLLRKKLDVYLGSRSLTTALVCHVMFPLSSPLPKYLPYMSPSQKEFNKTAFCVNDGRANRWDSTWEVIRLFFDSSVPNHLSLLRRHFDVAVMELLKSLSRQHFTPTPSSHPKPWICKHCRRFTERCSMDRTARQWRVRQIYSRAGIKLYRYQIPHQHNREMHLILECVENLIKGCSRHPDFVRYVLLHIRRYVCTGSYYRQSYRTVIQRLLFQSGRFPRHEKVRLASVHSKDFYGYTRHCNVIVPSAVW